MRYLYISLMLGFTVLIINNKIYSQTVELEKGWESIKPFLTVRSQVEAILGKPISNNGEVKYITDKAVVLITYSWAPCSSKSEYTISDDTVRWYRVVLKSNPKIEDIKWKKELYKRVIDPEIPQYIYYENRTDGIRVMTTTNLDKSESILNINYLAPEKVRSKFLCKPLP